MATKKGSPAKRGAAKKGTKLSGPGSSTKIGGVEEGEDYTKQARPRKTQSKTKLSGGGSGGPKLGGKGAGKKRTAKKR